MINNWYNKNIRKISGIIREEEIGLKRKFDDLVVNVEHPAGTDRYGVDPEGKEWRVKMKYDYGFLPSFKGEDDEGLDVYVGPNHKSKHVYIIHQNNPRTGEYDEDKCMMGFEEEEKAKKAYLDHYDSDKFFGSMSSISFEEFKDIVKNKKNQKVKWKKKIKPIKN